MTIELVNTPSTPYTPLEFRMAALTLEKVKPYRERLNFVVVRARPL